MRQPPQISLINNIRALDKEAKQVIEDILAILREHNRWNGNGEVGFRVTNFDIFHMRFQVNSNINFSELQAVVEKAKKVKFRGQQFTTNDPLRVCPTWGGFLWIQLLVRGWDRKLGELCKQEEACYKELEILGANIIEIAGMNPTIEQLQGLVAGMKKLQIVATKRRSA